MVKELVKVEEDEFDASYIIGPNYRRCTSLFVSTRVGSLSKLYYDHFMRSVACVKRLTKKFKKHCHSLFESTRVGSIKKFTTVFVTLSINFSIIIYS